MSSIVEQCVAHSDSGAGVAKVTAGTGVAYSVTGAGAARVAAALTPCAENVLHIRDADNFRKAVQRYLPSPNRRPTDDATNWDIMGLSTLRQSNFPTDRRHVVAVKLRLRGGRDQLFALLEMGNVIDDRSWRGMLRVRGVGDRWCSLLYKSGVADLRLLQYVGDSVAIHVDTCHGHRGCLSRVILWWSILCRSTVLHRNSMLPGCPKTPSAAVARHLGVARTALWEAARHHALIHPSRERHPPTRANPRGLCLGHPSLQTLLRHPEKWRWTRLRIFGVPCKTWLQLLFFGNEVWRCGVDVQWFQERSSQALPNSKELSV